MKKISINTIMRFTISDTRKMNIPDLLTMDGQEELWTFAKLDRHKMATKEMRYLVSTYSRVYDTKTCKLVEPEEHPFFKSSVEPYRRVKLKVEGKATEYLLHRLVAHAFLTPDPKRPLVNHIDGNPAHNWLWNLEWTNTSENYIHAIRTGLKKEQIGEERSNAKWTDEEIHMICKMMEEGHKATYIYQVLLDVLKDPKVQYERVRTLYKHIIHKTHWTHISSQYDIDFTPFNYAKEQASVNKKKRIK